MSDSEGSAVSVNSAHSEHDESVTDVVEYPVMDDGAISSDSTGETSDILTEATVSVAEGEADDRIDDLVEEVIEVAAVLEAEGAKPNEANLNEWMAHRPIPLLLAQFGIPSGVGMFIQMIYAVCDMIIVGQTGGGSAAISGIGLFYPIEAIQAGVGIGLGSYTSSAISQALGAKDLKKAQRVIGNVILLSLAIGIAFPLALFFIMPQFLEFTGGNDETMKHALPYSRILLPMTFFQTLIMIGNDILRGDGKPLWAMVATISSALINVSVDLILIPGFGLGTTGCAIATVCGTVIPSCCIIIFYTFRRGPGLKFSKEGFIPDPKVLVAIATVGSALLVQQVGVSITTFTSNAIFKQILPEDRVTDYIAAFQAAIRTMMLCMVPLMGIGIGGLPIYGFSLGRRLWRRLAHTYLLAIGLGILVATVAWAALMAFPRVYMLVYTTDQDTVDAAVVTVRRVFAGFFTLGFIMPTQTMFLVMFPPFGLLCTLSRSLLIVLPVLLVLGLVTRDVHYMLCAQPVADLTTAVIAFVLLLIVVTKLVSLARKDHAEKIKAGCETTFDSPLASGPLSLNASVNVSIQSSQADLEVVANE
ncbi:Multi antimicrobial extrusion protein [Carpediemonas membranifera]|uniref:Multi antimicrobial extrusion protein n=1 Tax=Carpediemonas membranifera TaxID=201153 RepID=A0A8J6B9T1_9EUKA|nr:Multi antimicrobial extrusion protein [Carpediemonas membranifera]|eukprot:KAG9396209.1 Multi antimicrobial extrusion protein [Carpediemonas membranifera]